LILAIDPGSKKCGLAIVGAQREVVVQTIVATPAVVAAVNEQVKHYPITVIVIGNRTRSKEIQKALQPVQLPLVLVEEDNSTLEGRYRYLRDHTTGLARLLPIGLRVPKQPYDDYVAVILAERYLKLHRGQLAGDS
jgi:RNase H-fold protein (predicted Holliday junction resolvase)